MANDAKMKYHEKTDIEKLKFTPSEVSEKLGVPYWMVWRLSRLAGFKRDGKKWARFTESDVLRMKKFIED